MGEGAACLHGNTAERRRQCRGGGPPSWGTPLPRPVDPASRAAAPGDAQGPCAVIASRCPPQPHSTGVPAWQEAPLGLPGYRKVVVEAGLRSIPAVPPQGPEVPAALGNGRTLSPGPLDRAPPFQHPAPLGTGAGGGSGSPPGPLPLPCSQHSNILHTAAGDAAGPAAPNLPPTPGIWVSIPSRAPCWVPRPHQLVTPPRVTHQPGQPTGASMGKEPPLQAPYNSHGKGHPALTGSMAKSLQGPCAPHLHGGHPSQRHLHTCPKPLQYPARRVPALRAGTSTHAVESQPHEWTSASMPWGPQHSHCGVPAPQPDPSTHALGTPVLQLHRSSHTIRTPSPHRNAGTPVPHLADPCLVGGPQHQCHGDPSPMAKLQHWCQGDLSPTASFQQPCPADPAP